MKRSALSLAVAAAVTGIAGSATAQTATRFDASLTRPGHNLVFPYYNVQNGNSTLISLTNTDTANGKAVKVRFRGASNSDDVLDFQVLMSPGDVWTANVSAGSDGVPRLSTTDNSCTIPSTVRTAGAVFNDLRISQPGLSAAAKANELREGYIEVITMADIPPSTVAATNGGVYNAIKHNSSGIAPCTVATLEGSEGAGGLSNGDTRLSTASVGLYGNWTIINVANTRTFNGEATALIGVDSGGAAGTLAKTYFRQSTQTAAGTAIGGVSISTLTSDPLFLGTSPAVVAQVFDFPDLSTPSLSSVTSPTAQANNVTAAISGAQWASDYITSSSISGETDLVLAQPTRRYYVAINYANKTSSGASNPNAVFNTDSSNTFYTSANVTVATSVNGVSQACVTGTSASLFSREEQVPAGQSDIGTSPGTPGASFALCGEVPVLSINGVDAAAGVFSPTVAANITMLNTNVSFGDGWISLSTPAASGTTGLPVIPNQFSRAFNPLVSAGTSGNFGARWTIRKTK